LIILVGSFSPSAEPDRAPFAAADTSKENCQRAMDATQRLALQLRAAEDRVRDLEADVGHYKDQVVRAEKWLLFISRQIEQQFLDPTSRGSFDRKQ
jgi:hypothetical protein